MLKKISNEEFVDDDDTDLQRQTNEKSGHHIISKVSFCKDFIPPDYLVDGIL